MPILGENFKRSLDHGDFFGSFVNIISPSGEEFMRETLKHDIGTDGKTTEWNIHFEWNVDTSIMANWGLVRIFGLSQPQIRAFEKGKKLVLQAGWLKGQQSSILSVNGTIDSVTPFRFKNGIVANDIFFVDTPEALLTKATSRSFKPGVSYSDKFSQLVSDLGIEFSHMTPATDGVYKDGCTTFGRVWLELRRTALDMRSKMYVYNGAGCLLPPLQGIPSNIKFEAPQLQAVKKAYITQEFNHAPLYVNMAEQRMLNMVVLFEPDLRPDTIFELGGLTPEQLLSSGLPEDEIGNYRTVKFKSWSDNTGDWTSIVAVPTDIDISPAPETSVIAEKLIDDGCSISLPQIDLSNIDLNNVGPQAKDYLKEQTGVDIDKMTDQVKGLLDGDGIKDLNGLLDMFKGLGLPDIDLDALGDFGQQMLDNINQGLDGLGEFGQDISDAIKSNDVLSGIANAVKDQGFELAKNIAMDALSSVVPVAAIDAGFKVLSALAEGDTTGALSAVAEGVLGSVPGLNTAKSILAIAAPLLG